MTQTVISSIATCCGIAVARYEPVYGGDINQCYRLLSNDGSYFLKLNDARRFPGMFAMEAEGLNALRNNAAIVIPEVAQQGTINETQWLLLQWVEQGLPHKKTMENFGAALAAMHLQPQPYFGWSNNNYIGSLQQLNTHCNNWVECYGFYRIMPLVRALFDAKIFSATDIDHATEFCKNLDGLFPDEPPALLHGDLWSGNYMINTDGHVVIFDPAVYFGHREMDLGMTRLFGGFNSSFYDAYNEYYPLEKNWQQRFPLTQLYPLLVHAVLFGGQYVINARAVIKKYGGR